MPAGRLIGPGGLIENGLVPPPSPHLEHSIAGSRANEASPYGPMLLTLGRHRVYPALIGPEYTEFIGGEHWLKQVYSWGIGDLEVSDLRLGPQLLSALTGAESQTKPPGERPTIAHPNVDAVAGAALTDAEWVERRTAAGTLKFAVDLVGVIFSRGSGNSFVARDVGIEIRYRAAGTADPWINRTLTLRGASELPVRHTETIDAGSGQWDVQVRRTAAPAPGSGQDRVTFQALRSYGSRPEQRNADTITAVAVRASAQVSGTIERLSGIVRQRVPTWDGAAWSVTRSPSSNPAALFRAYLLGWHDADGRLLAGAGYAATLVDDVSLGAWYQFCAAYGHMLSCDLVFQQAVGAEEAIEIIARCGRAVPVWRGGKMGVAWEDEDRAPVRLIAPPSVIRDSFAIEWAAAEAADEIAGRYNDAADDWQQREIRRSVPGMAVPAQTAVVDLRGITSAGGAARAVNLLAARQAYQRRRLSWAMGREGIALSRGDVCAISHDLVSGGVSGRLAAGTAGEVTLDRPVAIEADSRLTIEYPGGGLHDTRALLPAGEIGPTARVRLGVALDAAPDAGADGTTARDWIWALHADNDPLPRARVTAVRPAGAQVAIEAADESAAYYAAATSELSAPLHPQPQQPVEVLGFFVAETLVRAGDVFAVELGVIVSVSGPWRGGEVYVTRGGIRRHAASIPAGETSVRWLEQPEGTVTIAVVPGSFVAPAGAAYSEIYTIVGVEAPPPVATNFLIDQLADGTRRFRWTPPDVVDFAGIVIRMKSGSDLTADWDDMTPLGAGVLTSSPLETFSPPEGLWVFAARSVDVAGNLSVDDVRIAASIGPQRTGNAVIWRCPGADGWPGTAVGALRSDDGLDALEGAPDYDWTDRAAWSTWTSFGLGDGDEGATAMSYTEAAEDIGIKLPFSLSWSASTAGSVTFQYRAADTSAALASAAWADYAAGNVITARWVQVRWLLSGDGSTLLHMDHLCWSIVAPGKEVRILDADTSTWGGSLAAGRRIPAAGLLKVTDVRVTLQSVAYGTTWAITSKAPPTLKIWDRDGTAIDATVDVVLTGVGN